jgi:hypothetical protein
VRGVVVCTLVVNLAEQLLHAPTLQRPWHSHLHTTLTTEI